MGGLPEVVVGMDANMPCIGLAVIARSLEASLDVLRACRRAGLALSEPFYTRVGLCFTTVVELPWYENPVEFLGRRLEGYLKRYAPDIARVRRLWGSLEWRPLDLGAVEADALGRVAVELLDSYRIPYGLPATVAEDLAGLLRSWGRRWARKYNWSLKVATGRVFTVLARLSRRHTVLVKLEKLKLGGGPAVVRRWPHSRLLKLTLGCTPAWVGVALVDPRGTSRECPACGGRLVRRSYRRLRCRGCGREWHRDAAAGANVALAPVRELLRPPRSPMSRGCPGRGESGDEATTPPQPSAAMSEMTGRLQSVTLGGQPS